MKYLTALSILLTMVGCKDAPKDKTVEVEQQGNTEDISSRFSIEVLDDEALQIIDPKSEIEVLASGFEWTEGPLWIAEGNYLLFSDIPNNKVYKLDAKNDTLTYLHPSGFSGENFTGKEPGSNGLLLNQKGELVLMQHGNRGVAKMNATLDAPRADYTVLVGNYEGKRFNSPNDGAFDKAGNLYFTDPPYGLPEGMDDPGKELDFQGVYCLLATGELRLVDTLTRPNGIGLSPDNLTLYVAVSDPEHAVWYAYGLDGAGKTKSKKLFFDTTHLIGKEGQQGLPDGLKVNEKGYVFATGPGGVWIFSPEGRALARIHTGQKTANCAFTPDQKRLYMTADDYVLSVALK